MDRLNRSISDRAAVGVHLDHAKREMLPLDFLPPVDPGLLRLLANLGQSPEAERREELLLLHASVIDEVTGRLQPHLGFSTECGHWASIVRKRTFD